MRKQGDLWDDSALINAFDEAISKYTKMHGQDKDDSSIDGSKVVSDEEENLSVVVDESHEPKRHMVVDDNSNIALNTSTEIAETNDLSQVKDNFPVDSFPSEPHNRLSNSQHGEAVPQEYPDARASEEYTALLNKYYELEEQRQKILQQLNQFGHWNCDGSGSNVQWTASSTSQVDQLSAYQSSYPPACCPYGCQYMVTPWPSRTVVCSYGKPSVDKTCNAVAAEFGNGRSVSSLLTKASPESDLTLDQEKEKETNGGPLAQSTSSETDLAMVMNAWLSAGFYTGKYLSEQSLAKYGHL